ncbi:MAG: glycosyltransferase family 4 protein [Desulfotomaculaceae bacterium]|nr:glycosyltransferase family 4 protein [Desulfotomaculaceae bacterium]
MKIGIFTDSYSPYTSGVVRSIQTFKEELIFLGHDVFVFAPSYKNCNNESRVFRFASIPSLTNREFTLAVPFSLRLKPIIQDLQLDLIHVHSPFLLGRLGAKYARKEGIPLVFTYHTLYEEYVHYVPFARSLTKELAQKVSRDFCNQCDLVIVPTAIIGDYLQKIGVKANISKVPTGIKIDQFQNADKAWLRQHFNIGPQMKILLFVGRLGQEKNIGLLLESFSLVNVEINQTILVLVGGGPEEEELRIEANRLGIGERVVFTGTLPPEEVANCYAGSDLFVFSSISETQGIVIAEAKAAGLPVVAVGAYGVSEMVEHGVDGYLTEPDPLQLAEYICHVLRCDSLRQQMSIRARHNAIKLSSANCTAQLVKCYTGLLGSDKDDSTYL